jgi:hypothetical protein
MWVAGNENEAVPTRAEGASVDLRTSVIGIEIVRAGASRLGTSNAPATDRTTDMRNAILAAPLITR